MPLKASVLAEAQSAGRSRGRASLARGQAQVNADESTWQLQTGSRGPGTFTSSDCFLRGHSRSRDPSGCRSCLGIQRRPGENTPPASGVPGGSGGAETPPASGVRARGRREGGSARPSRDPGGGRRRRTRRASHVVRLRPRRLRRRARARPCGGSPGGVGRTIMKDSASAASARAESVLSFPWAVPARRPQLPTPETLPDRWLQAAEEEEEELLPFRSPPREENGTAAPSQSVPGGGDMALGAAGRERGGLPRPGSGGARSRAGWGEGPPELPGDFRTGPGRSGVRFTPGCGAGRREQTWCHSPIAGSRSRSSGGEGPARRRGGARWGGDLAPPRSASELGISRERGPPGAGSRQIREPSALLKFCPGREGGLRRNTKGRERTRGWSCALFAAQRALHRYIFLWEPAGRDWTILTVALAWDFLEQELRTLLAHSCRSRGDVLSGFMSNYRIRCLREGLVAF